MRRTWYKKSMRSCIAAALAIFFVFSLTGPLAVAADSAAADTLRLEKTEGTVALTNKSGKELTILSSMKLFNGYGLETKLASYAWLSLDGTKAVKIDAGSKAEVRESGKKLEVNMKTGSLYFSVTAPLKEDESLNIRTSTMVTGIRGTCGWINVLGDKISEIYILEGEVIVTSFDPLTGESVTDKVSAG